MTKSDSSNARRDPDPFNLAIGKNLRRLRKAAGLSQAQLGDAIGVRFQQIQKYEAATNRISAARLKTLADVLDVSVLALYGEVSERALARPVLKPPADMTMDEAQEHLNALSALTPEERAHFDGLLRALKRAKSRSN